MRLLYKLSLLSTSGKLHYTNKAEPKIRKASELSLTTLGRDVKTVVIFQHMKMFPVSIGLKVPGLGFRSNE